MYGFRANLVCRLCLRLSYRSPTISRLYIQVSNDDHVDNWPDEKLWDELSTRLGDKDGNWKVRDCVCSSGEQLKGECA